MEYRKCVSIVYAVVQNMKSLWLLYILCMKWTHIDEFTSVVMFQLQNYEQNLENLVLGVKVIKHI
jgi:hypothetical protein